MSARRLDFAVALLMISSMSTFLSLSLLPRLKKKRTISPLFFFLSLPRFLSLSLRLDGRSSSLESFCAERSLRSL